MQVKIEIIEQGEQHKSIKITGNEVTPWDTYEGKAIERYENGSVYYTFENDNWIYKLERDIGICMDEVFLFLESDKIEDYIRCDDIFPPKEWEIKTKHKESLSNTLAEVIADRLGLAKVYIKDGKITARTKDNRQIDYKEIDDMELYNFDLVHIWDLYQDLNKTGDYEEDEC